MTPCSSSLEFGEKNIWTLGWLLFIDQVSPSQKFAKLLLLLLLLSPFMKEIH